MLRTPEDRLIRFGAAVCRPHRSPARDACPKQTALQIVRSSTSRFANYGEVQGAESRRDFIHKLGIVSRNRGRHVPGSTSSSRWSCVLKGRCGSGCGSVRNCARSSRAASGRRGRTGEIECRMQNVQCSGIIEHDHWTLDIRVSEAGGGLLSHDLAIAVPSALTGLTTVFGMGTGVALSR